ncbi:potassium-transporting ATPase subunit C [Mycobacterium marseillense]|uniref:Potassium-transporting ATPase KdpC subunit n=1 Tax=Mycobacterium marseillense TaxID=701042 RepID=A0AAC9VST0_9MYCO|nr:potassium-transporting ATPase subunit C [Mycobacterium marseillense]ASW89360.1 K+-transporting ATPase subunit C [Mycobacterium marseillense]
MTNFVRLHGAALRALLVLTAITGLAYPLFVWAVAQLPGLREHAEGSILTADGKPVGSRLIGQPFTDSGGNPLRQYFQSRPSAAGAGYDPTSSGGSNLGPESIIDTPAKPSLLTQVCSRSVAVGKAEGVDGSRPFCTGGGVGAVLSVIGPRDARGNVVHPTRVVSVNEPCGSTPAPFLVRYEGVRVECARYGPKTGEDYSSGQTVPVRGAAPANPAVPADAVTASGSGLDPNISPAYADIQVARVASARHVSPDEIRAVVAQNRSGRALGFFGEPCVDVLQLNLQLDRRYPVTS